MTIQATIPDFLFRQAAEVALRENTSVDSIIAIALSSQVTAWQVRDTVEQRAQRGTPADLEAILAAVPDVPAVEGDEIE
jgi:hypothetical protein